MIIEEKKQVTRKQMMPNHEEHRLELDARERLTVNGVENIDSFSDTSVVLDTNMGRLVIKGENLHINKLDVSDGNFALDGKVNSVEYLKKSGKKGGFFENLFR